MRLAPFVLVITTGMLTMTLSLPTALAQSSDRARAEQHFEAGKRLRKEGKCAEAVEELKASLDFEPTSVGARLNLGDCYVVLGKLPEAFRQYKEAEQSAQATKDPRVEDARKAGAAVEAKLVRVVLREEDSAIPNVTVTVDGASAGARPWASIAVMPNTEHQVEASTPDGKKWSAIAKGSAGDVVRLTIVLRRPQEPAATTEPAPVVMTSPPPAPPAGEPSPLRTIGIVTAATGGILTLTGAIFGVLTISWRNELRSAVESNNACAGGYPNGACNPSARKDLEPIQDRAFTGATIATIGLIAGGVLAAGGITMYLAAPTSSGRPGDNVRVSAGPGSFVIDGRF